MQEAAFDKAASGEAGDAGACDTAAAVNVADEVLDLSLLQVESPSYFTSLHDILHQRQEEKDKTRNFIFTGGLRRCVKPEERAPLLALIARDPGLHGLSQEVGGIFRLCFDLDFSCFLLESGLQKSVLSQLGLRSEENVEHVEHVLEALSIEMVGILKESKSWKDQKLVCVSMASPLRREKDHEWEHGAKTKIKLGVHVRFPYVYVDVGLARDARQILVEALAKKYPVCSDDAICDATWESIIDKGIYRSDSVALRLPFQVKIVGCDPKCESQQRIAEQLRKPKKCISKSVIHVNGRRQEIACINGRKRLPWVYERPLVVTPDGVCKSSTQCLRKNKLWTLTFCSLFPPTNEEFPTQLVKRHRGNVEQRGVRVESKHKMIVKGKKTPDADSSCVREKFDYVPETSADTVDRLCTELICFLNRANTNWKVELTRKSLKFNSRGLKISTTDRYCLKARRTHSSANVFFFLDGKKLRQYCNAANCDGKMEWDIDNGLSQLVEQALKELNSLTKPNALTEPQPSSSSLSSASKKRKVSE